MQWLNVCALFQVGGSSFLFFGMGAPRAQPFGLADDGFRTGQFRGIGNSSEEVFVLRLRKGIMAFVSECLNALAPCQKYVFSKIAKLGVLLH